MENPIAVVKSNVTLSKILGFAVLAIVVFAVAEVTGLTSFILAPVATIRSKFRPAS
jgi:hypothetical protein